MANDCVGLGGMMDRCCIVIAGIPMLVNAAGDSMARLSARQVASVPSRSDRSPRINFTLQYARSIHIGVAVRRNTSVPMYEAILPAMTGPRIPVEDHEIKHLTMMGYVMPSTPEHPQALPRRRRIFWSCVFVTVCYRR